MLSSSSLPSHQNYVFTLLSPFLSDPLLGVPTALFWVAHSFDWPTLLSTLLSNELFWELFFSDLLLRAIFWALVWAVQLVWALLWALSRVHLLSRALFWVDLLSRVLFWALFGGLLVHQNLPRSIITNPFTTLLVTLYSVVCVRGIGVTRPNLHFFNIYRHKIPLLSHAQYTWSSNDLDPQ